MSIFMAIFKSRDLPWWFLLDIALTWSLVFRICWYLWRDIVTLILEVVQVSWGGWAPAFAKPPSLQQVCRGVWVGEGTERVKLGRQKQFLGVLPLCYRGVFWVWLQGLGRLLDARLRAEPGSVCRQTWRGGRWAHLSYYIAWGRLPAWTGRLQLLLLPVEF